MWILGYPDILVMKSVLDTFHRLKNYMHLAGHFWIIEKVFRHFNIWLPHIYFKYIYSIILGEAINLSTIIHFTLLTQTLKQIAQFSSNLNQSFMTLRSTITKNCKNKKINLSIFYGKESENLWKVSRLG